MKPSLKRIAHWLCLLVCGGVFTACSPNDARIIGPPQCTDDADCGDGQCVDFSCIRNGTDASPIDPDARLSDTARDKDTDTCTDTDCSVEPGCEPGFHLCDGSCVSDTSSKTCGDRCQPCPSAPNGRTTCDQGACGIECDAPFTWSPAAQACVQCQSDTECTEVSASSCSPTGVCVACTADAQCAHLGATPICAQGVCVACTDEDASACGPNSCDPATHTCTDTPRGALLSCQTCVSDSECQPEQACAPMDFKGVTREKMFCLPIASPDCQGGFPTLVTRDSANGVSTDFCTLNEELTTCEGFADYGARCADASECGVPGFFDSLCEPIDFDSAACTFSCTSSEECPTISMMGCATGAPDSKYCGAF